MASDTSSTQGQFEAIRQRFLTFVPDGGGTTLDTYLRRVTNPQTGAVTLASAARLYVQFPAEPAVYPYALLEFTNRASGGEHKGEREAVELRVTVVHRPRSKFWELQAIADVFDQAMLRWADPSDPLGGFLGCKDGRVRNTVPQPPAGSPADREVVQEVMRYPIISWPRFLNRYRAA